MVCNFFVRRRFLIISAILIALISVNIICIFKACNNPVKAIERKWGLSLPSQLNLVYQKNDIGWFGEGQRYSLFVLDKVNDDFSASLGNASYAVKKSAEDIILQMSIPPEYMPKWEEEFKCKLIGQTTGTHMCILYFFQSKSLIICEEIC